MKGGNRRWALGTGLLAGWAMLGTFMTGARAPAAAAPLRPVHTHEDRYTGRHREDPRFEQTFGRLEGSVRRSLRHIEDRLGLAPTSAAGIHVYVRDADTSRYGHDRARCRTKAAGGEELQHVELYAEYFVSGDADLDTVVTHELVHAVMRQRMRKQRYERLPPWLREGLAVHVAGEGERHLRRTLLACEKTDALMTGLVTDTRSVQMYAYAWLAVEYLVEKGGPTALRRLARGLVAGRRAQSLIARITDGTWETFQKGVRAHAKARIDAAAAGLEDIKRTRKLYRARKYPQARVACGAFLAAYPHSAFAPTARYIRARSWYREGRFKQAAAGFRECLSTDTGRSGWVDECHLYLGIALCEREAAQEGLALLQAYVELHPYATQHDLGWLAVGRALRLLERELEARAAFRRVAEVRGARAAHRAAAARELAAEDA